jgi:phosphoribosylformylglycinamidine synthase
MAFASHCGFEVTLDPARGPALAQLFSEECGVVLQVSTAQLHEVWQELSAHGLQECSRVIGRPLTELRLRFTVGSDTLDEPWVELRRAWSFAQGGLIRATAYDVHA